MVAVAAAPALVFDHVTVIDVEHGQLLRDRRVTITGNRIQSVSGARRGMLPRGAHVVNAQGQYLIPGLWDAHAHPNVNTGVGYNVDFAYPALLASGVTGFLDRGAEVGLDTLVQWRREVWAGTRLGPPRQILSGPQISEAHPCKRSPGAQRGTCVGDSADARHLVDSLVAAGADMIKTYELSPAMYRVIAAEAGRLGRPFGGHARKLTPFEVADAGARIVDHAIHGGPQGMDTLCWGKAANVARCQPIAERFRLTGTWYAPTLLVLAGWRFSTPRDSLLFMRWKAHLMSFWADSLSPDEFWHGLPRIIRPIVRDSLGYMHIAQHVDLPLLAGSDGAGATLSGFAVQAELAFLVSEGLTPLTALQAATLNPAKALHATDSLGTVAPGKLADLVLLDANPLEEISNTAAIRAVVANGRYYDRAALDRMLVEARTKYRQAVAAHSAGMLAAPAGHP